jgi:stage V sporulation protein SpoVS
MRSKISIVVIALCLVFGMAFTAYAAPMPDIEKHWAKEQINAWVGKGLINGYEDGTFRPDNNITRAEFMALVNRAFNYQEKVEIDYKDVADTAWYADLIKIAQAAGYISGYEDGTMKPNNPISRQEAATIIMKILGLEENSPGADRFKDATSIPAWSKGAVGAVASSGIMGGYPDGTFKAVNLIKRAEAVVALDKALKADVIYDKAGTYGPASGSEEISGNVIISAANVTLQNLVIEGNLTIDEAVGNGDVHLKQVTVKGDTYIYGGGKDSVYFIDCQTGKTYVLKDDGPVRIVVSGTTEINEIIAQSGLTVEEVNLTGEGIEGITVDKKVDGNIEINLRGVEVESLEINTEGVTVRTDRNTVIDKLVANEKTDFKGSGTIKDADINADGVTFDKMPDKYELAENVKQPTRSSSGGGGGSSKVAVSAISVEGDAVVGATLTAEVTPSGATVNYQWQRADDGATWNDIADATSKTYILSENEVGKLIRVKVTGTGNYTGTKISEAVGPVTDAPEPEVKGSIARDPGNTGGKDLTVTVDGETITFDGNIEWYPVDESVGRNEAGNRVGVEITAPEGFDASGAVVTIGDDTYENLFTAEKNYFWWYPLVTQAGQQFTATVVWNESSTQVFTVKIADTAKLEKAPVEEVTRTAAPTQDPGNTGGDLEYNFADGTLTISGTIADIPESTNPAGVTAKWIGVNIPKPTTDVADAGTIHLTIKEAGKEPVVHESVSYGEGDPFLYYFGAQAGGRSITLEIVWNGKHKETLVIEYVDTTEPEPEVKGSIARDPGKTGGKDLDVDIDGNTITFDGNIEWYPADPDVGRNEAGNRVGVEIIAPEGFDASGAVVTIDGEEYNDLFTAEKNYFWWYPLVSEAGETFTATVVWNEVSTQVFKVVIGEGALNQAVKAIAIAKEYVAPVGITLHCEPSFVDLEINGSKRTGIKLSLLPVSISEIKEPAYA